MRDKDRTGQIGEQRAAEYLAAAGHRIMARRWRSKAGELDLVTEHEGWLVGVEVKTRRGTGYGHPLEAVTKPKLDRLHRLLNAYAIEHKIWPAKRRIDVVGVLLEGIGHPDPQARCEYIRDAQL